MYKKANIRDNAIFFLDIGVLDDILK